MPNYLKKRRRGWYLNLPIPERLRGFYLTANRREQTHIVESLHTRDQSIAEARAYTRAGKYRIEFLRRARGLSAQTPDAFEDAKEYRDMLRAANDADEREQIDDVIAGRIEQLAREGAPANPADEEAAYPALSRAQRWGELARAKVTIREAWAEWVKVNEHNEATKLKDAQALSGLLDHMKMQDAAPHHVTHGIAREYVGWLNTKATSARDAKPLAKATKEARIAPLRIFWTDYLEHHELTPRGANPWRGHKFTDKETPTKRPYTDAELLQLFTGPEMRDSEDVRYTRRTMLELYALLFFTGARLGEVANRLLGDVKAIRGGYVLTIPKSKSTAGVRTIPILHPVPVAILKRRIGKRKNPLEQLFEEFIPGGPERSLGWYVGKALGRYRDALGLPTEVDTHSTRRQLITQLVGAGHVEVHVQWYVGHKPKGITAGVYAKPTDPALRGIAQAIKLPPKVDLAVRKALDL